LTTAGVEDIRIARLKGCFLKKRRAFKPEVFEKTFPEKMPHGNVCASGRLFSRKRISRNSDERRRNS
jgi:hypothetical protein